MKRTTIYESVDSIIRVQPHEYTEEHDDKVKLAYITIYAGRGNNFIHINEKYVPLLYDICGALKNIYELSNEE